MQKYCIACSEEVALQRNGGSKVIQARRRSDRILRGIEISKKSVRTSITGYQPFIPDDGWMVSFTVPFQQAASKNHVWSLGGGGGHVFKRTESRTFQKLVSDKVHEGTRDVQIYQNKIWIDLFVQKPHHRGDAINVVDVICDGLKEGLKVDDRWFCLRQVDWEIAKHDPKIFISVYQNQPHDVVACSHCGRLLRLENFTKKRNQPLGVDRVCKDCGSRKKFEAYADPGEGMSIRVERAVTG